MAPNAAITATGPNEASVFRWTGIPLSSGSALPNSHYPIEAFGTFDLVGSGSTLLGFVGDDYSIRWFNGVTFLPWRKLSTPFISTLRLNNESSCGYRDGFLFPGNSPLAPGIFRAEGNALCQQFVPAGVTPVWTAW